MPIDEQQKPDWSVVLFSVFADSSVSTMAAYRRLMHVQKRGPSFAAHDTNQPAIALFYGLRNTFVFL